MSGKSHASTTMSIHAHIKELRTRLFVVALVFIVASMVAYIYRDLVIGVLLNPLEGEKLSYLTPGGGFSFIFKVVMWGGIAVALPFAIYVIYSFISPILPQKAQRKSISILVASFLLLICGAAFGYIYAIPGAMRFLLTFADGYINAMLTADAYLNFVLVYTVGLGVLFQIPLLMVITNWIIPLKPKKLLSMERYVVVAAFILAALITPTPDAMNQCIIAAPIIVMYQIGFFAVVLSGRKERRMVRKFNKATKKRLKQATKRPVLTRVGKYAMRNYYMQPLLAKRSLIVQPKPVSKVISMQPKQIVYPVVQPQLLKKQPMRPRISSLQVDARASSQRLQRPSRMFNYANRGNGQLIDGFGRQSMRKLSQNS